MSTIRVRLTVWYVAILTVGTVTLAAGSWWLSTQSVIRATDSGLAARIDGVRAFLDDPRTILTVEELEDEFREYAELTRGEALLQVISPTRAVLCRPAIPGWLEMEAQLPGSTATQSAVDRTIGTHPYRVAVATITARGQPYRVTVAAPMGAAYAALNRFHGWLLGLLPAVLLLSAAGGYVMSRRALAPVDQMTRAVQTITLQSLGRRVPVPPANDELSRLAMTFNAVLGRLDDAVQDIVRFTADASHELRTPVALVRTTAELALRHPRTVHEYREALVDVANHAQHMTLLVDDLLALARTDAGLEPRSQVPVDVRAVLVQVIEDMRPRSGSRALVIDVPPSPVMVDGDGKSLRRLFVILLENAIKYSVDGGRVGVRLTTETSLDSTQASIEVVDDGIGLDPSEISRLFERFFRGERARRHVPDGSGLGLAIARMIVSRHRGSITLGPADANRSRGCSVNVVFPLNAA